MFLNGASFLRFDGMRRMAAMERDLCGRRWTVGDVDGGVEVGDVFGTAAAAAAAAAAEVWRVDAFSSRFLSLSLSLSLSFSLAEDFNLEVSGFIAGRAPCAIMPAL